MTPTIGTTPPSGNAQPSATDAASSAAPTNFLMLLAQVVGQPAQQAVTPLPMQAALQSGTLEGDEPVSPDAAQLLPFALPFMAAEGALSVQASERMIGTIYGQTGAGARAMLDVKLVTDMIQAEQAGSADAMPDGEVFRLPFGAVEGSQHKLHAAGDPTLRLHVPVGNAQWADELGARLTTMTEQGRHAASLRLSPEHLGPLEVRISIRDDQASVWFGAAHADTRAAIEHALPRLREMFEAQGMALADAGVFQEAPREQPQLAAGGRVSSNGDVKASEELAATSVRVSVGLVDAYA